jgi:hypothetical protein
LSGSGFRVPGCKNQERSYETTFQKLELVLSWAALHFVGWVEPTPSFVGFRCTQPNLHFAGVIAKCETQQRPISEPCPKSFYFDLTGRFFGQRQRLYETTPKWQGFLKIRPAAFQASGWAETQNQLNGL